MSSVPVGYMGEAEPAHRFREAAADLGIELIVLTPDPPSPPGAAEKALKPLGADTLEELIARSGVVTLGHGCDHSTYAALVGAAGLALRPNPPTIRVAHDPLAARYVLQDCLFDFAEFEEVDSGDTEAVERFAQHHGWPVRLRAARWGTTEPAVHLLRPYSALDHVWGADVSGKLWLLEACEPLAPQLAVVIARRPSGQQLVCSVIETNEQDCRPQRRLPVTTSIATRSTATATAIVDGLDATGIVTVKFLLSGDGRLLVEDITYGPEPDSAIGAATDESLYAIHLRAILDWPLDLAPTSDPVAISGRVVRRQLPVDPAAGTSAGRRREGRR